MTRRDAVRHGHLRPYGALSAEAWRRTCARAEGTAGMAGIGDEDWDKLQDFDTRRLIEAVDDVDALRGVLADDGTRPPEIRDRLLKLHQLAMAVVNEGAQEDAGELFELAQELEDEALDMLEAVQRLHDTLSALTELRPGSLDDDGADDADNE